MLNRKIFFIGCPVFIIILIAVTSAILVFGVNKNDAENAVMPEILTGSENYDKQSEANTETTFYVTANEGVLCVYNCTGSSQILTDAITYIDIYSLDSDTKRSLDSGIVFKNRTEVIRFIENISS